jgi:hypothetical protein
LIFTVTGIVISSFSRPAVFGDAAPERSGMVHG